jgi:dUTPase
MPPRFHPKDLSGNIAFFYFCEQISGSRCISLGDATIKLNTKVLAQSLLVALDDRGDVVPRDTDTRQPPHSFAHCICHQEFFSRHLLLLIDRVPSGALLENDQTADPTTVTVRKLGEGEAFTIPPGQFAFLLTEEVVSVPADALAFISVRARTKFRGLVNVSGFHVDPGYRGQLTFSVFNAGPAPIHLKRSANLSHLVRQP